MPPSAFDKLTEKSVPHILERIFFSLDYESFKKCMEVSSTWRNFLSSEQFQKKAKSKFYDQIQKDLIQASKKGLIKKVKSILSNFMLDVDHALGIHGETCLQVASCNGHKALVNFLLDKGANPNKINTGSGNSPLYLAAFHGDQFVAELLIKRGANILNENRGGNTALHIAAYHGNTDVVKLLLNHGADPKAQNNLGENALAFAYWGSRYRKRVEDGIKILALLS